MNMMDGHGNRYLLVVASHPSYGQNPINRLYHFMDIPLQSWIETKSMKKSAKYAINIDLILILINVI